MTFEGVPNKSQTHRLEVNNKTSFRLAQLISIFVSVWLTAAGIIHLVSADNKIINKNIQFSTFSLRIPATHLISATARACLTGTVSIS